MSTKNFAHSEPDCNEFKSIKKSLDELAINERQLGESWITCVYGIDSMRKSISHVNFAHWFHVSISRFDYAHWFR